MRLTPPSLPLEIVPFEIYFDYKRLINGALEIIEYNLCIKLDLYPGLIPSSLVPA